MESTREPKQVSPIHKLAPEARPPTARTLKALSALDRKLLLRRLEGHVEYVFHKALFAKDAENELLGPIPCAPGDEASAGSSEDSGLDLLALGTGRALTQPQEQHLFLRLNYCRMRLMKVLERVGEKRLTMQAARELLRWEYAVLQARSDIVRVNVALVLAMAKRTRITGVDYADLISEGNLALMRAVDKFDCSRGFKFSTYACRAILKSFSRVASRTSRYRGYFPTEFDPSLEKSDYLDSRRRDVEGNCVDELKEILHSNLAKLNPVEEKVIRARFLLDQDERDAIRNAMLSDRPQKAKTLEQVGEMIGVTKERVRQIQNKALIKLREVLEEGVLAG